jgi:hypothetical protein
MNDDEFAVLKVKVPVKSLLNGTENEVEAKVANVGKRGGKTNAQLQAEWRNRQKAIKDGIGTIVRQFKFGRYRVTFSKVKD